MSVCGGVGGYASVGWLSQFFATEDQIPAEGEHAAEEEEGKKSRWLRDTVRNLANKATQNQPYVDQCFICSTLCGLLLSSIYHVAW